MSHSSIPADPRRHDLDALRAIAMLLGILLHGAISFIPGAEWFVKDSQSSPVFGIVLGAIHGFRMPLFFLISGFFTMMLLRKRGLLSLLRHRTLRIFVPLVLAVMTITPATWAVAIYIGFQGGNTPTIVESDRQNLFQAAGAGNLPRLEQLIAEGADINQQSDDGATPLLVAAFFGQPKAVARMLELDADPMIANHRGERPADVLEAPWGITQMLAGVVQIEVSQAQVVAGRLEVAELLAQAENVAPQPAENPKEPNLASDSGGDLAEVAAASETPARTSDARDAATPATQPAPPTQPGGSTALRTVIDFLMYAPILGHLWFLWFLCWLVAGFTFVVLLGRAIRVPSLPPAITASPLSLLWAIPLTMVAQWFMTNHGEGFGPQTSIGLLPIPAVLAYYAVFFGFGAMYFDANDETGKIGKHWIFALALAIFLLFPVGLATKSNATDSSQMISVMAQVGYAWLMSFGLMGLFRQFMSSESKTMRYLSDSSYWLYLAHIPLIILVQFWVRPYQVSPWIKLPIVCVITSAILLASYQLLVRYTPIGTMLNGKRTRPGHETSGGQDQVLDATLVDSPAEAVLALELEGTSETQDAPA